VVSRNERNMILLSTKVFGFTRRRNSEVRIKEYLPE
jgi:hypothetical protein